jgi:predicted RNase H-like HicB family nuclease
MGDSLDLYFETESQPEGGFSARCLHYGIYTQGDTPEQLRQNIEEAALAYFFDRPGVSLTIKIISDIREQFTVAT